MQEKKEKALVLLKRGLKDIIKAYEMLGIDRTTPDQYNSLKKQLEQLGGQNE